MTPTQPVSILLIEDEAIILLDMEYHLQKAGFAIAGSVCTCSDALTWLQTGTPDIAVLDVTLRDGHCGEVARLLRARRVPFIVHSGATRDPDVHDEVFLMRAWIEKPSDPIALVRAIDVALSVPGGGARPRRVRELDRATAGGGKAMNRRSDVRGSSALLRNFQHDLQSGIGPCLIDAAR